MTRGLSLIETVVATALLAMLVAAAVPIFSAARRDLAATDYGQPTPIEFERAVDGLMAQRATLAQDLLDSAGSASIEWSYHEKAYSAVASIAASSCARADDRRSSHCWVTFSSGETEAIRWLRLPHEQEGPDG